ncbi:hypothetical protein Trydic_g12984 [Trypoxylus dichotomus]
MLLEAPTGVSRQLDSFPDDVRKQVVVTEPQAPRLYGLPKIYKRDVSLRLIDGSFYELMDGVEMESPLPPVVYNLFLERFESLAIEATVDTPTV